MHMLTLDAFTQAWGVIVMKSKAFVSSFSSCITDVLRPKEMGALLQVSGTRSAGLKGGPCSRCVECRCHGLPTAYWPLPL